MQYLVVDTETTGLDPEKDAIIELAGVWRIGGKILCWHSAVCNPGIPIPPESSAIHHLTKWDLIGAGTPEQELARLLLEYNTLISETTLVAHNADFDRPFLGKLASGDFAKLPWVCTYRCSMQVWPDAPGHSNQTLRYWLDLDCSHIPRELHPHRALYDALVTERILQKLLELHRLEDLVVMTSQPILLSKVRFGKHKGDLWKDVPRGYLRFILNNGDFDRDVVYTARYHYDKKF